MKKRNDDFNSGIVFVSSVILVGLIVGVFASIITTATDKNDAKKQMSAVARYVNEQCIRYEELAAEDASRSLYDVSDKAFVIRSALDYGAEDLAAEVRSQAERNRLNGIFVTESTADSAVGRVVSYYSDGKDDATTWESYFKTFGSVAGDTLKSYCERLTKDGYYYDCAMVSRGDGNGAVLCYKRQRVEDVEDERFSIATLLKGFVFGSDGSIVVTDGNMVLATNSVGVVGMPAQDCPVVKKLRQSVSDDILRVEDGGAYYGIRTAGKNFFVYTFMPESSVFERRSVILPYLLLFYLCGLTIIVVLRQLSLRKKRLEQERKDEEYRKEKDKLAQEAIRANEAKTDFLRRMSHDIRTPINGLRGLVKIGEYYYDDPEKQKECREKIWDVSGYLLDLVNDMLDMNKLTTSEPVWKDENFVMSELLGEVESFLGIQAKEAGVAFNISFDIKHNYLFGGKVQFKRVLTNLVSNAIKYNKTNGKVDLSCTERESGDGVARFECVCADTGIGMDEEFLNRMYEPFERETQSAGNNREGVGLGLSIVRKLVDRAGWTISVKSKKGEGTAFTVAAEFKIADQTGKVADLSPIDECNRLNGFKILVAEDNELNLEIVEFILKVAGATIISATDGKRAAEIFNESEVGDIDAILMDVMMPVEDGLAATREIRASDRPDAKSVPIIAMTASAFAEDVENARTAGMNAYIAKPIDGDKLIDCILRLVQKIRGGGNRI